MTEPRRFWWSFLLLACALAALAGVQALAFRAVHGEALAALPERLRFSLWAFLAVTFATLLPVLAWFLWRMHRRLVWPWLALGERLSAALQAEPGTEVEIAGAPDGGKLADALNQLLRERESAAAHADAQAAARTAAHELALAKAQAMLDASGIAAATCSPDGRVTAYSAAAAARLGPDAGLGLGRPIDHLIDASLLVFARDSLAEQVASGTGSPRVECALDALPLDLRRVRAEPLADSAGGGMLFLFGPDRPDAAGLRRAAPAPGRRPHVQSGEPLASLRYAVIDTETTGLHPSAGDEIVSLAAIIVLSGRIVPGERLTALVDPGRPIGRGARRVHGIRDEDVRGQPRLTEVLPKLARLAEGAVLVAHNAAFDLGFLRRRESECGVIFDHPTLDTMLLSAYLHPNQRSHSLDALIERFGLTVTGRHSALGDAEATAQALIKLLPLLASAGILTLADALRAMRSVPLDRLRY